MSDHTLTYDPYPAGSAPITRCSCGWISKLGDDVHLISPHAVGMIADQDAQIAALQRTLELAMLDKNLEIGELRAKVAALEAEVERLQDEREIMFNHPPLYRYDAETNKLELLKCLGCADLAPFLALAEAAREFWSECWDVSLPTVKKFEKALAALPREGKEGG